MTFHNRTRVSPSIPQRLKDEGRWYLIPFYWLFMTSDLAAEAVRGSGSWKFADHIYRGSPSGRLGVGFPLDALLLRLAPARAFRRRYLFTRQAVIGRVLEGGHRASILSVPCGIPRDLIEAAVATSTIPTTRFSGIDLDPEALAAASREAKAMGVSERFEFIEADVFDPSAYPSPLDMIVSTGLGEFLDDVRLRKFFRICHDALEPGGMLVTSATARHRMTSYLLEVAELTAHYRSAAQLDTALRAAGFAHVALQRDRTGLQTFATATRGHR